LIGAFEQRREKRVVQRFKRRLIIMRRSQQGQQRAECRSVGRAQATVRARTMGSPRRRPA